MNNGWMVWHSETEFRLKMKAKEINFVDVFDLMVYTQVTDGPLFRTNKRYRLLIPRPSVTLQRQDSALSPCFRRGEDGADKIRLCFNEFSS